jgi:hypothetical protein
VFEGIGFMSLMRLGITITELGGGMWKRHSCEILYKIHGKIAYIMALNG